MRWIYQVTMGGIFYLTQLINERRANMLLAILQAMFKFVLILGTIFGLAFMVICTAFVIVCGIRGDISINIVRNRTEEEEE